VPVPGSPAPPALMPDLEFLLQNESFSRQTFGGVFGKCEWQDMKKNIGHLPTKFIEITPLNSVEFLYSKGK
jgi:hypothetical protein